MKKIALGFLTAATLQAHKQPFRDESQLKTQANFWQTNVQQWLINGLRLNTSEAGVRFTDGTTIWRDEDGGPLWIDTTGKEQHPVTREAFDFFHEQLGYAADQIPHLAYGGSGGLSYHCGFHIINLKRHPSMGRSQGVLWGFWAHEMEHANVREYAVLGQVSTSALQYGAGLYAAGSVMKGGWQMLRGRPMSGLRTMLKGSVRSSKLFAVGLGLNRLHIIWDERHADACSIDRIKSHLPPDDAFAVFTASQIEFEVRADGIRMFSSEETAGMPWKLKMARYWVSSRYGYELTRLHQHHADRATIFRNAAKEVRTGKPVVPEQPFNPALSVE